MHLSVPETYRQTFALSNTENDIFQEIASLPKMCLIQTKEMKINYEKVLQLTKLFVVLEIQYPY